MHGVQCTIAPSVAILCAICPCMQPHPRRPLSTCHLLMLCEPGWHSLPLSSVPGFHNLLPQYLAMAAATCLPPAAIFTTAPWRARCTWCMRRRPSAWWALGTPSQSMSRWVFIYYHIYTYIVPYIYIHIRYVLPYYFCVWDAFPEHVQVGVGVWFGGRCAHSLWCNCAHSVNV